MYTGTQFDSNIECQCAYSFCTNNIQLHIETRVSILVFLVFSHLAANVMKVGKNLQWKKQWKHKWSLSLLQCAARGPPSLHHLFFLPLPHDAFSMPPDVSDCGMAARGHRGQTQRGNQRSNSLRVSISPPRVAAKTVVFGAKEWVMDERGSAEDQTSSETCSSAQAEGKLGITR